ncbi:interleukin-3 receptor subunit alpha isoform X1 [Tupaia chinensis]|uniref:interleukin-3 receptor subunit alpha isoform X1 n=1 Tax=Tupaia chinensis TaxID=246437 RepID=UPI0003C912D9|nr:interleukin-3 receptor subunit alpha isoform X1 [Tupaia chinensis]
MGPDHEDPNAPIRNLRVEPGTRKVTWDRHADVTGVQCRRNGRDTKSATNNNYCVYNTLSLCNTANYTVSAASPPFSTWVLFPEPARNPGAAARNLNCRIHDVDFLTCTWAVGAEAPRDVQYHLHLKDYETGREVSCASYQVDSRGTHVGCRWARIATAFGSSESFLFLVNGTAGRDRVPCTDMFAALEDIEILSPPNITTQCNATHAFMQWSKPSHYHDKFTYDLRIKKSTGATINETLYDVSNFRLLNPGSYSVSIRAQEVFVKSQSAWSAPQHFECDPEEGEQTRTWRLSLLIALGTLLAAVCTLILCKRSTLRQKIFPPIPHMKNHLGESFHNKLMVWEAGGADLEDCPVTEVHETFRPGELCLSLTGQEPAPR